ncbi:MAG TPA: hypothetical protein VMV49_17445 [Candidatus Deferrimicrobium sp.]|nr:hypothetical protein [Candidatus Deferrimicrobium sp.]
MPGVNKLSWLRKMLIGLGKKIYYRKTEKVNVLGVNLMLRAVIRQYEELIGNLQDALNEFQSQVMITADEVITNLIHEPLMMGVSMSYALSRDIKDGPFTIQALIYGMIGKDYKKTFEYPELVLNEDQTGKFVIRTKGASCILCSGVKDIQAKDLGNSNYGNILATLFGTIIRQSWNYLETPYELVEAKETKCLLRGDPYGEITISFKPKAT